MHRFISQCDWDFRKLREFQHGSAASHVGIRAIALGPDYVMAEMPVDQRTRQPYGLWHGGMSLLLAEELGSVASGMLVADEEGSRPVGVDIGGTHLRPVRSGRVTGLCRALRIGRSTHFWRIGIHDKQGRLCCDARITVQILRRDRPEQS